MTMLSEEELAFAALQEPVQARPLSSVDSPARPVDEGKGVVAATLFLGSLLSPQGAPTIPVAQVAQTAPSLRETVSQGYNNLVSVALHESLPPEVATIRRWNAADGVYTLSSLSAAVRLRGAHELLPPEEDEDGAGWVIDARAGNVLAHVASEQGEFLLRFERTRVELWSIERAQDPALDRLQAFRPTSSSWEQEAVPDTASLLGTSVLSPWLKTQSQQLRQSASWLDQVASVGLLSRLYSPAPSEVRALIEQQLAGEPAPLQQRVREWAKGLSPQALATLERSALDELDVLDERLDDAFEREAWDDLATLRELFLRRDDLESIAWVLQQVGKGATLQEALSDLDQRAELHLSAFQGLALHNERLAAVAWQDPLAWWGAPTQAS